MRTGALVRVFSQALAPVALAPVALAAAILSCGLVMSFDDYDISGDLGYRLIVTIDGWTRARARS